MTDKKLTDEEIVKALECCKDCSINLNFEIVQKIEDKNKEILELIDIINRQNAEIERLKECPKCVYEYDDEVTEYCIQGPCPNFKTVEQIKNEAYKESAGMIKDKWFDNRYDRPDVDFNDFISNLLKEIVGEEK